MKGKRRNFVIAEGFKSFPLTMSQINESSASGGNIFVTDNVMDYVFFCFSQAADEWKRYGLWHKHLFL